MCSLELPLWRSVLGNLDDKRKKQTWCPPSPRKMEGGGGGQILVRWGDLPNWVLNGGEIVIFPHLILVANISYNVDSARVGDKVQRLGEKVQKCEYTMRN